MPGPVSVHPVGIVGGKGTPVIRHSSPSDQTGTNWAIQTTPHLRTKRAKDPEHVYSIHTPSAGSPASSAAALAFLSFFFFFFSFSFSFSLTGSGDSGSGEVSSLSLSRLR